MVEKHLTYGWLDRFLKYRGFAAEVTPGKARIYQHPATGASIQLPDRPLTDPVTPHHLVAVRGVFEGYGLEWFQPGDRVRRTNQDHKTGTVVGKDRDDTQVMAPKESYRVQWDGQEGPPETTVYPTELELV